MLHKNLFSTLLMSGLMLTACNKPEQKEAEKASETAVNADTVAMATAPVEPAANKSCFMKALNRDTTTVTLEVIGDKITGSMHWNPYQKDGAIGTLTGTKNATGEFELMYNYMIEGNNQSETKIMKIENGQLLIKKGELEDPKNDGNMRYKDASKATYKETLKKVDC